MMKKQIRDRFKEIQEARQIIKNASYSHTRWISAEEFMSKIKKDSLSADSANAALKGFVDKEDGLDYVCPIEDFSPNQLADIDEIRGYHEQRLI